MLSHPQYGVSCLLLEAGSPPGTKSGAGSVSVPLALLRSSSRRSGSILIVFEVTTFGYRGGKICRERAISLMSRLTSTYTIYGLLSTTSGLGMRHTGPAGLLGSLRCAKALSCRDRSHRPAPAAASKTIPSRGEGQHGNTLAWKKLRSVVGIQMCKSPRVKPRVPTHRRHGLGAVHHSQQRYEGLFYTTYKVSYPEAAESDLFAHCCLCSRDLWCTLRKSTPILQAAPIAPWRKHKLWRSSADS
jgi:hypothetical protein